MFHGLVGPETLLYLAVACTFQRRQSRNPYKSLKLQVAQAEAVAGAAASAAGFAGAPAFLRPGAIIMII